MSLLFSLAAVALLADEPKPNALTPKEVADGWLLLFDGESAFGWKVDGPAEVKDGTLVLGGGKKTVASPLAGPAAYDLRAVVDGPLTLAFAAADPFDKLTRVEVPAGKGIVIDLKVWTGSFVYAVQKERNLLDGPVRVTGQVRTERPAPLSVEVAAGDTGTVRSLKVRPTGAKPLFNGKDLSGWKLFAGDPKRMASTAEVTKDGELSLKNGPGDLQTDKAFADFVLQLDCKTLGKGLNSGVFFRCLPGQYQQGYEAQIQNSFLGDDRTKPLDFGTGAIYRRVPARKVVSNDNEWFTMTVAANGPHISTWVNGYPTVSWTDDRKPADSARQGLKTGKGHLSLQGHDPTTDLLFRNIRIAELPEKK